MSCHILLATSRRLILTIKKNKTMTVQELIDELNKVEDKSLPVYHYTCLGIDEIEEREGEDVTLF